MNEKNKRGNDRISSKNLLSYVCVDDNNETVVNGMGRTLNVSESGIMLETHTNIDNKLTVMLSIGLEDSLIELKGKIIHSKKLDKGKYHIGIQFVDLDKNSKAQLSKFINAFKS